MQRGEASTRYRYQGTERGRGREIEREPAKERVEAFGPGKEGGKGAGGVSGEESGGSSLNLQEQQQ